MTNDPRAVPPAQRTLPAMLRLQAALFGPRALLRVAGQSWTHADAAQAAAVRAGAFAAAGVARGDRVAVMCGNRIEFVESFLGAGWMGAAVVPVNTASMGPQLEYFLADSEAKLLVIEAGFVQRLATADLSRTALREIWVVGDALPFDWQAPAGVRVVPYPEGAQPLEPTPVQPGDPLAILYTSGTTGPAKGVVCPHAQYFWWGVNSAEVLGVDAEDVLCTTLPLFHINALNTFAQAALTGAQVVFEQRFSASGFWPSMRASGATVVYLLGAMVPILLAQPEGAGERDHRVRIGLGPGRAGCRGRCVQGAHGRAAAGGLRLDRDQLRDRHRGRFAARRCHGLAAPGLRRTRGRRGRRGAAARRGRRAAAARRRTPCLRERLLQHAGENRRGLAQPLVPHR
jgi:crotonobetaine/carnitine-CoA ligase